jgi:hypothetical protein
VLKGREALSGERAEWAALAAGAVASFASTVAAGSLKRGGRSLLPAAAYRSALATTVLRRLRQNPRR